MNRRELMKTAPAALVMGTVPAAAETPILTLFREWIAHRDWMNGPATRGMSNDDFDEVAADNMEMVERLLELPAQDARDLCCKLLAVTEMGADLNIHLDGTECLPVEARSLIGGEA